MKIPEILLYSLKRWGIFIFIITASIFLLLIIHRKVYAYYSIQPAHQINLSSLEVLNKPDWCAEPYFKDVIYGSMKLSGKVSLFDNGFISQLLDKYNNNAWVAKVKSIEKQLPDKVIVKLELRKPVAVVEMKKWSNRSSYYLVDKDSVRLPGEYYTIPSIPITLPVIVGVRSSPPLAGAKWLDKGLSNALDVAGVLKKYQVYPKLDVAGIDITNIDGKINKKASEIVIVTKNNVQIEWGRPIKTDKLFEISAEEKIKNLYRVLEISPQLQGIKYVKIQFDQPYIVLLESPKTPSAQSPQKRSR
ncbi:MAG: hypothetical protein V1709_00090 [Planctomycetota bacterium]